MKGSFGLFANGIFFYFCLVSTGCGELGGDTPRTAWERYMESFAARDYGALWDSMSEGSRQDTIRVLTHVQRDSKYRETMQHKFKIPAQTLANMQPRDFFIAIMNGADRALPEVVKIRAEQFKSTRFVREQIQEDRAMVYWEVGSGGDQESMAFVLENGGWKPVIRR